MIDLATVRVMNGSRDPLAFPVTATLISFGVIPGTMYLETSGTAHWPSVAIDESGAQVQAATLWVFLQINGIWYAAGAERLRPAQLNGAKPNAHAQYGGLATLIGHGWFGKHDPPLAGYNPADGEVIGVMVVAGNTRFGADTPVRERSNILCVEYRAGQRMREVWREGAAAPVPTPPVVDQPVVPIPSAPELTAIRQAIADLDRVTAGLLDTCLTLTHDIAALRDLEPRVTALEASPAPRIPTRTQATTGLVFGRIPVAIPSTTLE